VTRNYRELVLWRKAMDLVEVIYAVTRGWPKEEVYGLTSQVRRAAVSIPANVAEGHGRNSKRDFLRFLMIANGSLLELETHLFIAHRLDYIAQEARDQLLAQTAEIDRVLEAFVRSLRASLEP
jgi:four helix bundle protein